VVTVGSESPRAVELTFDDTTQSWTAQADGKEVAVRLDEVSPDGAVRVEIDGEVINLRMATSASGETLLAPLRSDGGVGVPVRVRSDGDVLLGAASGPTEAPAADPELKAPITGVVLSVSATLGQTVQTGEPLMVLEAMKMETVLKSPRDGVISAVHVEAGSQVRTGEVLIEVTPDAKRPATSESA
jgi:biotin carboxyl carrier protein